MQEINWFSELFLSTDIWGWFGPLILIFVTYSVMTDRRTKPLGILFLIADMLILWNYIELVGSTPWYWWNIIIMILGVLLCLAQMRK